MGDESSTDEVLRINRCFDECSKAFDACMKAWMDLYDNKKVSTEQAIRGMDRCLKASNECDQQCLPIGRRHFDDKDKEHFKNAGLEFEFAGGICAIAGLGVITLFAAPIVGGMIIGFGAGFIVAGAATLPLIKDPIDPNFSKVPVPSFPKLPPIRPVRNTGLTASVARAANAVLENQAEAIGLLNALLTALNRSDGAAKAGDASAEERQLKAARDFAKKVAKVFRGAISLRLALASKWTGPGLDFSISERDALKLRDEIIINGFPSSFLDRLKKLGVDRKDQDVLLQRLFVGLAKLPSQPNFRDVLMDPRLPTAERRLALSLEGFSRSR
jgi:hypothetical protein